MKDIFYSVLFNKCPACNQGSVFKINNPYNLKHFDKMDDSCTFCETKYEKEPGFFQGAMYVSYALMSGWFMITWALDTFIFKTETVHFLLFFITTIILFMPVTFRTARLIWLNFFIKFDKNKCDYNQQKLQNK